MLLLAGVTPVSAASITCPANITTPAFAGVCGATVSYPPPTVSGTAFLSCDPTSSSSFPVGVNVVGCAALNPSPPPVVLTCEFTVTVLDAQAPTITCPADIAAGSDADACGGTVEFAPLVADNCGALIVQHSGLPSGSVFPPGTTLNALEARDSTGNSASCQFSVQVTDTVPPTITCPADIVLPQPGAAQYEVHAEDACEFVELALSQPSGSVFRAARTVVGATARDAAGNTAACTFAVLVQQGATSTTLPPQVGCTSEPTFGSIGCRLTALVPMVAAATTEPVRSRLSRLLDRAGEFVRTAESLQAAGRRRGSRTALRKSIARLRRFGKKIVAPKSGLAGPIRDSLADAARILQADVRVLMGS